LVAAYAFSFATEAFQPVIGTPKGGYSVQQHRFLIKAGLFYDCDSPSDCGFLIGRKLFGRGDQRNIKSEQHCQTDARANSGSGQKTRLFSGFGRIF
jgi:hypothetical protein